MKTNIYWTIFVGACWPIIGFIVGVAITRVLLK